MFSVVVVVVAAADDVLVVLVLVVRVVLILVVLVLVVLILVVLVPKDRGMVACSAASHNFIFLHRFLLSVSGHGSSTSSASFTTQSSNVGSLQLDVTRLRDSKCCISSKAFFASRAGGVVVDTREILRRSANVVRTELLTYAYGIHACMGLVATMNSVIKSLCVICGAGVKNGREREEEE